ncbi:MAG: Crp/Fnr family transcriptional regulator [Candidatus Sumerlaeia bacterium]|nr:Crp/Fnr family transcriptional regulator [Candidatus Sumerlaeia bacterium]
MKSGSSDVNKADQNSPTFGGTDLKSITQDPIFWYLSNLDFFQDLREESIDSLSAHGKLIHWDRGTEITQDISTSQVFFIVKGRIEISTYQMNGKKLINDFVGEGGVLGWNEPTAGLIYSTESLLAVAFEDTEAIVYDRDFFVEMIERRPKIAISLLRYMGLRQQRIEFRLRSILFKNNLCKVAGLILELGELYGLRSEGKVIVDCGLSQEDIGAMVGLPREEVTRALSQLKHEGYLVLRRRRIEILNHKALSDLIE